MIATAPPVVDTNVDGLFGTGRRPVIEIVASAHFPSTGDNHPIFHVETLVGTQPASHARVLEADTNSITLSVPKSREKIRWNSAFQREYDKLAMKEAYSEAGPDDMARLGELQEIRRRDSHPRSAREMVLEFERRQALSVVVSAMKAYAQVSR